MENETLIIAALQQGVTAAIAQSDAPNLPVKYLLVGEDETTQWRGVPQDQKWLELVWIPNNSEDFRDNALNHRGMLRLVLHWPNDGGGVYAPIELFASITRYFTKGRVLMPGRVQIYRKPTPTGIIEEGEETLFPITLYYQSYQR